MQSEHTPSIEATEYRLEVEAELRRLFGAVVLVPWSDEVDAVVRKAYERGAYASDAAMDVGECQSFHDALDQLVPSTPELDQFRCDVQSHLSRMYGHPLSIWCADLESTLSELFYDGVYAADAAYELDGCITGAED